MRRHFVTAAPDQDLASARQTMRLARLRHLLVVREERLVGLLSYRDLVDRLLAQIDRPHAKSTLADAMIRCPAVLSPATSLAAAASQLCLHGLGCLPVVEEDDVEAEEPRMIGLITEVDLLRVAFRPPPSRS